MATRQSAVDWLNAQNGKKLDFDGAWGAQCVDYFNYYYQHLVGVSPYAHGYGVNGAKDLWNVNTSRFDKIANNPNDANQIPQPGDILIYNSSWGGGYGHVEMVLSADASGVNVSGQNMRGVTDPVSTTRRSWGAIVGGLIGWMSYKNFETVSSLQPYQRQVAGDSMNYRERPTTSSAILRTFAPGDILDLKGFVRGENVSGNPIWFVGLYTGGYIWSGGFTSQSVDGLADLTPPPVVVEPPKPVIPPYEPKDPEMVDVEASDFPAWVQFEKVTDPDDTDKVNQEAYEYYKLKYNQDYKYYPIESCTHWWGTPNTGITHDGVVNQMKNTGDLSVDFVVSANRVTSFGSLKKVSYTTGARSMYQWTSENDPNLTEDVYKTMGLLHYVVEKKNPRLKGEPIRLHKEFMQTACSNIDVKKVRDYASQFAYGDLDFNTGKPPVKPPVVEPPIVKPPVTPPDPEKPVEPPTEGSQTLFDALKQLIDKLIQWLKSYRKDK